MSLDDTLVEASKDADIALVIEGRTAGEDQDTKLEAGSYLLTDIEKSMIAKVTSQFDRVAIILNVGNIIDMSWVKEINPPAIMYVWQGGQEGGHGVVDVLTGAVNPCGKLTDTIARSIEDYPSTSNFGSLEENFYVEDIYVGYRYFESFSKDKVLGKPSRSLVAFEKTKVLQPEEEQILYIRVPISYMTSYDDSNVTGNKSSFILEAGNYSFYVGSDVRKASLSGSFALESLVNIEQLSEAYAPIQSFERMKPHINAQSNAQSNTQSNNQPSNHSNTMEDYEVVFETVPTRTVSPMDRLINQRTNDMEYTGDKGLKLGDVYTGKVTMDTFIAQLSDDDLIHMFRGEGMCSPKVTPGTAAAFGGLTPALRGFGIPAACCADGPSGIRMDCGTKAFSLANGTVKHFTANNQEAGRRSSDSIISERALREIYLKGFEIAIKEGGAGSVMTTYGAVNGIWTAGSYDLCTTILSFIMRSPAMLWELDLISEEEKEDFKVVDIDDVNAYDLCHYSAEKDTNDRIIVDGSQFNTSMGSSVVFGINLKKFGKYAIELKMQEIVACYM